VTDEELRELVAALPDAGGLPGTPRDHVVKARPDAVGADALGADLAAIDAWVEAQGGRRLTAHGQAGGGGVRPGQRTAPPPAAPQRVYVIAASALAD
jgi:hypothetical protein